MTQNKPIKFTLLTACKNEEKDVHLAIESALAQTYPHKEIIFVDDSTDRTPEIIRSYSDRGVILVEGKRHGCCQARNLGLSRATGDVIVFLTADTKLESGYLEKLLPYYEKGYDWVTGESLPYNIENLYSRFIRARYLYGASNPTYSPLATEGYSVRREAALAVGGISGDVYPVNFCRDWTLGKKLTEKGYKKIFDRSLIVPNKAPDNFKENWQVQKTRGLMSAYQPYFLFHRTISYLFIKFLVKDIIAFLRIGLIIPAMLYVGKVAKFSPRNAILDFFPMYYAYLLFVVAFCMGEWQGWWYLVHNNHNKKS
jgi:glycosyltransferase involved in cell wall biosynthesis